MSDESTPDPNEAPEHTTTSPSKNSDGAPAKPGRLRQIILFTLLGLMLMAAAYDYIIARPNVDKAYDQISQLNNSMNSASMSKQTLNTDIHKEINRTPEKTYTQGPYRVEVFSWMAGLPFRTHDLYAVYTPKGNDLVFMRHYKFAMPKNELDPPVARPRNSSDDEGDDEGPQMDGGGGGGGFPPFRDPVDLGDDRPQRPEGESEDSANLDAESSGSEEGASEEGASEEGASEEGASEEGASEEGASEESASEESASEESASEESASEESASEEGVPEASTPKEGAPKTGATEGSAPAATAEPAEESAEANPPPETAQSEAEKKDA
jgi:hypothetical protein